MDVTLAQVLLTALTGFASVYLLRTFNKQLAGLMKVSTIVLCLVGTVNLVAQMVVSFREAPIAKLFARFITLLERIP